MTRLDEALVEVVSQSPNGECRAPLWTWMSLSGCKSGKPDETVAALSSKLAPRSGQPVEFVRKTRVLPARTGSRIVDLPGQAGIAVDLVFALWPFEQQAIAHAVIRTVGGVLMRVASLEYLLFLKLVSDRSKI
jgi:hypothetical protein